MTRPVVYVTSPINGDRCANQEYAKRCVRDSIARNEAPIAAQTYLPDALDSTKVNEGLTSMFIGLCLLEGAALVAVYADRGTSERMVNEINHARACRVPVEIRNLEDN